MVFEKVIEAITISDFSEDIVSIQSAVSTAISSMFDTWKFDINALRDRMMLYYAVRESKSLDVGSEKKKKSSPDVGDGLESPPKKQSLTRLKKLMLVVLAVEGLEEQLPMVVGQRSHNQQTS